jgi:hypothetical protein
MCATFYLTAKNNRGFSKIRKTCEDKAERGFSFRSAGNRAVVSVDASKRPHVFGASSDAVDAIFEVREMIAASPTVDVVGSDARSFDAACAEYL